MSEATISAEAYLPLYELKGKHFDTMNGSDFVNGAITSDNQFYEEYYWLLEFYEKHPLPTPIASDEEVKMLIHYAESGYAHNDFKKFLDKNRALKEHILGPSLTDEEFAAKCQDIIESSKLPEFIEIPDGIFRDYIAFGKKVSYSKPEFHFASLLAIASMAIGRKAVVRIGMMKIHLNVFIMVAGHTTISGKSVACNLAVDNISSAVIVDRPNALASVQDNTEIQTGSMSDAALVQTLSETWNQLWYFDDCGGFFDEAQTWNAHILGTLCSVYDGTKTQRKTSKNGKNTTQYKWVCDEPYLSMLFNTTIANLQNAAYAKMFTSGFFPRVMWFIGEGGEPRENTPYTKEDEEAVAEIRNRVMKAQQLFTRLKNGSVIFRVNKDIEAWNLANNLKYLAPEDEQRRAACGRGFVHIYKIAANMALMDPDIQSLISEAANKGELPIELDIPEKYAKLAIKIMDDYLLPRMMLVTAMGTTGDERNHQVIVTKALAKFGGCATRTNLLKSTDLKTKELDDAIKTLVERESIKVEERLTPGAKKPTTWYLKR